MTAQRSPRLQRFAALALCALGLASASWAQNNVAINTTGAAAAPSAILDVSSLTQGLFVPRMATLPPIAGLPNGLTVFRTGSATIRGFYVFDYGQWMPLLSSNKNAWDLYGNHLGNPANPNPDYLGTSDNLPMYFRTNNLHRMRLDATTGNLGVGFAAAAAAAPERLDINGALRMYYVPNPGVETSNTNAEGVMRYQTYGTVTGSGAGQHGTNEVLTLTGTGVVAPQPAYPIIQAGHWGNVNGTAYTIGTTTPSITQPDVKGWRLFENVYEEGFNKAYTHFKEATCVTGTADLPSGPAYYLSNHPFVPVADRELLTPFLAYTSIMYMRRQYLFLPRELNMELAQVGGVAATEGLCAGQPISQIGFYVASLTGASRTPAVGQMDVTVRHAPTGLNALNGFDNAPYFGTPSCGTVSGANWPTAGADHWQMVTIAPPFVWDGTSNVIIEVAMKYNPGPTNVNNNPVRVSNAGFNATYAANCNYALYPQTPDQSPNAPSCNSTANPQTRMGDSDANVNYHSGVSQWRPVVRFSGTVAHVDAAAPTSGNSSYLTYPGAFIIEDTLGATVNRPWGLWRPGYPTGNSYWANQGDGTISAQHGVYDNGSRLNDFVFDRAFDGKVAPKDAAQFGDRQPLSMDEMAEFTKENRHLPTMKGRDAWEQENGFSLGDLTNQLWATTETQTLYVTELHDKLNVIEMLTNERPITAAELQLAIKELSAMADLSDGDKARLIADLRKRATLTSTSR